MTIKRRPFFLIGFLLGMFFLLQCNSPEPEGLIRQDGIIDGKIENFRAKGEAGRLSYFDAISRISWYEEFEIEEDGTFSVSFSLPHAVFSNPVISLPEQQFAVYLEPGKDLKVTVDGNQIRFSGRSGLANRQMKMVRDSINRKFADEVKFYRQLHTTGINDKEYIQGQQDLSEMILEYIDQLDKSMDLQPSVSLALRKEIYYTPANLWISLRFEPGSGPPAKRKDITPDFFNELLNTYSINDKDALVSRSYTDYIFSIKEVISEVESFDSLYQYVEESGVFEPAVLSIIRRAYRNDTTVFKTKEFSQFNNSQDITRLHELEARYRFHKLLDNVDVLPAGIGRDLIISQGLCDFYYKRTRIKPAEKEWARIKELISTQSVIEYLEELDSNFQF